MVLAAAILAPGGWAQGTIQLANTDLPSPDGRGTYDAIINVFTRQVDGNGNFIQTYSRFPGAEFTAGLFLEGGNTPLATTPFLTEFGPQYG